MLCKDTTNKYTTIRLCTNNVVTNSKPSELSCQLFGLGVCRVSRCGIVGCRSNLGGISFATTIAVNIHLSVKFGVNNMPNLCVCYARRNCVYVHYFGLR